MSIILTIRHLSGSLAGKSQRVALQDGQVLRLGRSAESDIRFSDATDDSVSGVHAELSLDGQRLYVEDKRSANGTFVNGAPCPPFEKVAVPDGSRLRLAKEGPEMQVVAEAAKPAAGAATGAATGAGATALTGTAAGPAKESVGKATLLREIERVRQEERDLVDSQMAGSKRSHATLLAAGLTGVLLLGAGGFGSFAWWNDKQTQARLAKQTEEQAAELARVTNAWSEVERKVSPAVVHIRTTYSLRTANGRPIASKSVTGSGVQIRPGLILTARHVVEDWRFSFGAPRTGKPLDLGKPETWNWDEIQEQLGWQAVHESLEVQFPGQQPITATLVSGAGERTEDLALLQIHATTAPTVPLGRANSDVKVTDDVAIIGYPGILGQYKILVSNATGVGNRVAEIPEVVPTFMRGTVAQPLTDTGESSRLLFFDASIEHGNSGGPVVNRNGELIGIVSLQYKQSQVVDFNGLPLQTLEPMEAGSAAVPPDYIQSFLRKHGIV